MCITARDNNGALSQRGGELHCLKTTESASAVDDSVQSALCYGFVRTCSLDGTFL